MKGMLASLENKALNARPKKKRRAVLFSDSDDDLDQETDEVTNSATAPDEINAYLMLIPLQIFTLRTGTKHLWLSGSCIALASRNWWSSLEVSIQFRRRRTRANERSVQLDTTDLRTTLDPEHLDELLLLRSFNKLKGSIG